MRNWLKRLFGESEPPAGPAWELRQAVIRLDRAILRMKTNHASDLHAIEKARNDVAKLISRKWTR